MIEETVEEVTRKIRHKINSSDVNKNIKKLLISLIEFETRNMHLESKSYAKDYDKLIKEFS